MQLNLFACATTTTRCDPETGAMAASPEKPGAVGVEEDLDDMHAFEELERDFQNVRGKDGCVVRSALQCASPV
jgi:hypothetical protein